jgi:hypothetical protein
MKQESGQNYCALPWCGRSFGAPYHSRVFLIGGDRVKLTYPSMVDYHDIIPRSAGGNPEDIANQVPLCHECHMAHHSDVFMRLEFGPGSVVSRGDGRIGHLVTGYRDHLDAL